jgi:type IV fimbrial biogenesis protein FimT
MLVMNRFFLADSKPRRGFTLIEMLTVVSVLAVVAAIAAPGMRSFAATQRVKSLAYDLTTDLLLARSEALKRGATVRLAPSGADWGSGWTVAAVAAAENIGTRSAVDGSLTFTNAPARIDFDANGRVAFPLNTDVRMSIGSSAAPGDNSKRCIELDPSGRARSKVGACT